MKRIKNRLISLILTLVIVTGALEAVPLNVFAAPESQTRTLMLYAVGSNLESGWGCATWNLVQSMEADHDENLNYIVMTGGSDEWHTEAEYLDGAEEVDAEYDQIWKLEGKRSGEEHGRMKLVEPTGIEGFEKANMGKAETLIAFIDYCYENYPADQYDLILWDHGGAFSYGFGIDDRFTAGGPISIAQLADGLGKTKLFRDRKKFEIIDFDACLMAGVEVAATLAPYTDYLVVSAEFEPGSGQEYTTWLNALREDPGMNGFELGRIIVDGLAAYYSEVEKDEGTLSVIDLKNFSERLMPLVTELDDILIREAKTLGTQNGRFNFYDELYSLLTAYGYGGGDSSLYDLGTLAGGLSSPQSEMDNADDDEIDGLENAYTGTALKILAVLGDCDGSGDDVIYSAESAITRRTVDGYYVRGLDGAFLPPDENGYLTIDPTGLSVLFGDGSIPNAYDYLRQIKNVNALLNDEQTLSFLKKRGLAASYYALIVRFGQIVSELSETSETPVTWADVKEATQTSDDAYDNVGIPSLINYIADCDGDFASADEVETYFSKIVEQQAGEALLRDKLSVKKLVEADGSSTFYQVTIRDASSQSLMSMLSTARLEAGNYRSPEFDEILNSFYEGKTYDALYPDGVFFFGPDYTGTLDYYRYYEKLDDSDADIYRRVYSDTTSVWIVPQVDTYCFVLTDRNGVAHPARIEYRDRSRTRANLPIRLVSEDGDLYEAYLVISFGENGWQADGVSFYSDTERSCYPMDNEFFNGLKFTTAARITDAKGRTDLNPISQFCEIDVSEKDWGISLGWKKIGEVEEIVSSASAYFVTDVYGHRIDVTGLFAAADKAAKEGDVAYTIGCADLSVAEAVYDGAAQAPKVTATLDGETLTEGVDYKVLYDGSRDPGSAHLTVIGIGNFYGALGLTYTIKEAPAEGSGETQPGSGEGAAEPGNDPGTAQPGNDPGETQLGTETGTVDTGKKSGGAETVKDPDVTEAATQPAATQPSGEDDTAVAPSGAEDETATSSPADQDEPDVSEERSEERAEDGQSAAPAQTGDGSGNAVLWIVIAAAGAVGAASLFIIIVRRRKRDA